ncbi:MAG: hypothetical protein FJ267_16665 [Planctomycetes bacterium]|nr:hypothetical protein [Planctomycetota bacterium]
MFDLSNPSLVQFINTDPGIEWEKELSVAIEAAPDDDTSPLPQARWSASQPRTGICGAVSPRIVALPDGGYRMYYSQILPRPGFPSGATAKSQRQSITTKISNALRSLRRHSPEPARRLAHRNCRIEVTNATDNSLSQKLSGKLEPAQDLVMV